MAKLADAIHFDYIEELCEEILDRLNEDDEEFVSVVGTYDGIRAFIKEFMTYDDVGFDSLVINDPKYNDYYDEYVVDIWNNDGEILFGCEPAKRDGRCLNCEGNVLYLLDDVKQAVLNTCEYDEKYFVIIGEDDCDRCEDCVGKCPCDCHKEEKEIAPTEKSHYSINGKPVSKAEFDKKYTELQKKYEKNMRSILDDYCDFMDEFNTFFARLW
jgi:NAD-dependent dihydropyrimidine dehydrogenase PreA subunit